MTLLVTTREDGSLRVQTVNEEPEVTKQSHKDEVDINLIIDRYDTTGLITHLNRAEARFADVSEIGDYTDALEVVRSAEEAFMSLPAATRKIFDHSAAAFLDAAHDPDKRDLLVQAGLLPEPDPPVVAPPDAPVVPPAE